MGRIHAAKTIWNNYEASLIEKIVLTVFAFLAPNFIYAIGYTVLKVVELEAFMNQMAELGKHLEQAIQEQKKQPRGVL